MLFIPNSKSMWTCPMDSLMPLRRQIRGQHWCLRSAMCGWGLPGIFAVGGCCGARNSSKSEAEQTDC